MLKVRCRPMTAVELFTLDGKSLGLFREVDGWQGLKRYQRIDKASADVVIVDTDPMFSGPRPGADDDELSVMHVVKASTDITLELTRRQER